MWPIGAVTAAVALAAPPRAIVLMLADDYGYNNVGFAHGPLSAGNPEMRCLQPQHPLIFQNDRPTTTTDRIEECTTHTPVGTPATRRRPWDVGLP